MFYIPMNRNVFTSMNILIHEGETNMKDLSSNKNKLNVKMKFTLDELWVEIGRKTKVCLSEMCLLMPNS